MLLIDKIEGNSGIGVPVYSRFGQMQNYNYIALSPQKEHRGQHARSDEPLVAEEH